MSSSLFENQQGKAANPQGMFNRLMRTNPQFKAFVEDNRGKSPQQIASEHGIDWNLVERFMK